MDVASPNSISNRFVSETYQRNTLMILKVEGCIPLLRLLRCGYQQCQQHGPKCPTTNQMFDGNAVIA